MTKKTKLKPVSKTTGRNSGIGGVSSGAFITAADLKNNFFAHTSARQAQKVSGDASYWTGGRCDWGGSHNLMEDCGTLANFFNSIANINNDIQEMTLAVNEQDFDNRKQQLANKLQDCISKCEVSSAWSIGNVCCIWNDFFGSFLKSFLDRFKQKLQSQLNQLQTITAVHQKDILRLEAEIKQAEAKYQENFAKAERETDPTKKARFMALANEALDEVTKLRKEYSQNPIATLNKYDYLNDLQRLINGNLTDELPTQPGSGSGNSVSGTGGSGHAGGNNGGSGNWGGNLGNSSNNQQQPNQQQMLMIAAISLVVIFFLINSKDQSNFHRYEEYY